MNDVSEQDPFASGVGLLRQTREAAGLSIEVMAANLKVPVRKLEALEEGRYEALPDRTFARALAASACRQLGIDPTPVLADIPGLKIEPLVNTVRAGSTPFRDPNVHRGWSLVPWLKRPAVLVSLFVVLASAALWGLPGDWLPSEGVAAWVGGSSTPESPVTDEPAKSEPSTPVSGLPVSPSVADSQFSGPPVEAGSVATPSNGEVSVAVPATAVSGVLSGGASQALGQPGEHGSAASLEHVGASASASPAVPSRSAAVLSIVAQGESWVEVLGPSGAVHAQRLLRAGERVDLAGPTPYRVLVGKAEAVEITVRGVSFDLQPFTRNSVARFEIP